MVEEKKESIFKFLKKSLKNYLNIGMSGNLNSTLNTTQIHSISKRKYLWYATSTLMTCGVVLYLRFFSNDPEKRVEFTYDKKYEELQIELEKERKELELLKKKN
eukprot:gene4809-8395_t